MQVYIARRLLLAVPTFIGITISAEGKAKIRHALGLDRRWYAAALVLATLIGVGGYYRTVDLVA